MDGKTPIAVVVYKSGNCGQAMALKSLGGIRWGGYGYSISGVLTTTSASSASTDHTSCVNSNRIREYGDSSSYPAVWATYNYTTEGTEVGDWCLPAAGVFNNIYKNQGIINAGLTLVGGETFKYSTHAWSSTLYSTEKAWNSDMGYDYYLFYNYKHGAYIVWPVIEF